MPNFFIPGSPEANFYDGQPSNQFSNPTQIITEETVNSNPNFALFSNPIGDLSNPDSLNELITSGEYNPWADLDVTDDSKDEVSLVPKPDSSTSQNNQSNTQNSSGNKIVINFTPLKNLSNDSKTEERQINHIEYNSYYNYFNENYEKIISNSNVSEKKIIKFLDYLTFNYYKKDKNYDPSLNQVFNNYNFETDNFFENYKIPEKEFKKISIVDNVILKIINKSLEEKNFFPFYNLININYYSESFFVNYLEQYNLNNEFLFYLSYICGNFDNGNEREISDFLNQTSTTFIINDQENRLNIDLRQFFTMLKGIRNKEPVFFRSFFNQMESLEYNFYTNQYKKFLKNETYYRIFGHLLEKLISRNINSTSQEILGFQIRKIRSDTKEVMSEQFILNNNEIDKFSFIDTQVKFGVNYEYEIHGFLLIYFSKNGEFYPTVSRIKLNSSNISLSIKDLSPLPPFFQVFLQKTFKNTLLFTTQQKVGTFNEHFIPLNGLEPDEKISSFKNDDYPKEIQLFRLENEPKAYKDFLNGDLFTSKSTSILNTIVPNKFYYFTMRTVDARGQLSNPSQVIKLKLFKENGVEYIEYYDYAHYKEEIIEDNFENKKLNLIPWYLLNINDIRSKEEKISKTFKKFIQIKPSDTQLLFDNLKDFLPEDAIKSKTDTNNKYDEEIFGVNPDELNSFNTEPIKSISSKKYKLRIKSKNTGKVVDINFSYEFKKSK